MESASISKLSATNPMELAKKPKTDSPTKKAALIAKTVQRRWVCWFGSSPRLSLVSIVSSF